MATVSNGSFIFQTALRNALWTLAFAASVFALPRAHSQTGPAGFIGGNRFEFTQATGDVFVRCPQTGGGPPAPPSASYRCYGYSFTPGEYAVFAGPIVNADEVELTAFRQDGSSFTKQSAYDASIGRSTDSFNLWIETVFQKPLLRLGRNDVRWNLKKAGRIVATGSFIADVFQRASLRCPSVSETSWDPNDCINSSRVCRDYFYNFGHQCR